jgi:hypothetical protein
VNAPLLIREVGHLKASPLRRFGRIQRRAYKLAPRSGQPPGVIRFQTWEEVTAWQKTRPTI